MFLDLSIELFIEQQKSYPIMPSRLSLILPVVSSLLIGYGRIKRNWLPLKWQIWYIDSKYPLVFQAHVRINCASK